MDKQPVGGVIERSNNASSMMETIKIPLILNASYSTVIDQTGHTKDLWNYYWASYSRGTDGIWTKGQNWHNNYLDDYTSQRSKSIYDPCPYSFRIPSNGTYNNFKLNIQWVWTSYLGGSNWSIDSIVSYLASSGIRSMAFASVGQHICYSTSISSSISNRYSFVFGGDSWIVINHVDYSRSSAVSVRCIEK